jgi:8-oxo-dGTP diphosphatase
MAFTYEFPRPALTVDCVVFGLGEAGLEVLLIRRRNAPFAGCWALPGGFVDVDETVEDAAKRELEEETGVRDVYLEQLHVFSAVRRDPRERVVSVAFYALVKSRDHAAEGASDADEAAWFPVAELPKLAFDHADIFALALARLRRDLATKPVGFELLPRKFTLTKLQRLYEVILDESLDKRNFRKKILALDVLTPLDEVEQGVSHRAARLYRFDKAKYDRLVKRGAALAIG